MESYLKISHDHILPDPCCLWYILKYDIASARMWLKLRLYAKI